MSDIILSVGFALILAGILVGLLFKRSLLAKSATIFLITYPLGIWLLTHTLSLYHQDMAPTISRHNTTVLLSSSPAYAKLSIILHVVFGLFLLAAGTYFGIKRLREWRNAA